MICQSPHVIQAWPPAKETGGEKATRFPGNAEISQPHRQMKQQHRAPKKPPSDGSALLTAAAGPERQVRRLLRQLIHPSWGTCVLKFLWCAKPVPSPSASASSSGDTGVQLELPWPSKGSSGSLTQRCTFCNARRKSLP